MKQNIRYGWLHLLTERPRMSLAAWFITVALVSLGSLRLQFDFSPETVYSGQDDAVEFSDHHKKLFRFEDSICLVVLQATDDRTVLSPDRLDWLKAFTTQVLQIPLVTDVRSLLTLESPQVNLSDAVEGGAVPLKWVPLISTHDLSSDEALHDRLRRLPLLNDLMISADRRLLLTLVSLDPRHRGMSNIRPPVEAIEKVLRTVPLPAGSATHLTGVPPTRVDIIRSLQLDQRIMVPCCAAVFFVLALGIFRRLTITLLCLAAVLSAVAMTVGMMGWLGQPFNLLSNVVPPLSLIIAATNCVHIVSRFQIVISETDRDIREITRDVMSEMMATVFMTLATTAIGFGSLYLARSILLHTLAVQAMLAMFWNYVALMVVLSSGLVLLGHRLRPKSCQLLSLDTPANQSAAPEHPEHRWLQLLGRKLTEQAVMIVVVHLLGAGIALWWTSDMRVNSLIFETYDPDHPVMKTIALLDEQLSGMVSLEVQLNATSEADFFRPDVASAVRRIRGAVENDSRVTFWRDYTQILSAFDSRILSSTPETSTSALARIHRLTKRADLTRVTSDFLATTEPAARMMMRVHDIGSAGLKDLIARIEEISAAELPADIRFRVTGDAALHALCMDTFVRDLLVSLLSASGIIFVLIAVIFRAAGPGLISVLPNMLPLVLTLAWMKLRGFDLTAGNVIVFSISIGIAVDDTIHFLARFYQEIGTADSAAAAVEATVVSTGRAIVTTSILVVAGLSVLIFSDFVPTRRFAELTAITMLAALPGDIILLPALLTLFGRKLSRRHITNDIS